MKKIISLLLAMIMVFSLATVAFADTFNGGAEVENVVKDENGKVTSYNDIDTITFTKRYAINTNRSHGAQISPAETFSFTIEYKGVEDQGVDYTEAYAKANLPEVGTVEFAEGEAGKSTIDFATMTQTWICEKDVTITLPEYQSVGVYTYEIKEVDNKTAGVTYFAGTIKLVVTVVQGEEGRLRVAGVHCEEEGDKSDVFENLYESGNLSLKKVVTGNLGDQNQYFDFEVVLTSAKPVMADINIEGGTHESNPNVIKAVGAETADVDSDIEWVLKDDSYTATIALKLKHDETVTFQNIPEDVTYTTSEAAHEEYETTSVSFEDDNVNYEADEEAVGTIGIIDSSHEMVVYTNDKSADVDTGIALDSAPYFVILAVAMFGMVALVAKKRYEV